MPRLLSGVGRFESRGVLLAVSLAFCFLLAWLAGKVGLNAIVGAFAAGLLLDEVHFEKVPRHDKRDLEKLIAPVSSLLAPIFFVLMGLKVDLRVFTRFDLMGFAAVLTLAAIIGKQLCSLGVAERGSKPACNWLWNDSAWRSRPDLCGHRRDAYAAECTGSCGTCNRRECVQCHCHNGYRHHADNAARAEMGFGPQCEVGEKLILRVNETAMINLRNGVKLTTSGKFVNCSRDQ